MVKLTVEERTNEKGTPQAEILLPVDAIVRLKVEDARPKEIEGKYGPYHRLNFRFTVLDVETPDGYSQAIGQTMWGSPVMKLTDEPDNELRLWLEAILQMQLGLGYELETDELKDRQVRGVVRHWQGKSGARHEIGALLPLGGRSAMTEPSDGGGPEWPPSSGDEVPF